MPSSASSSGSAAKAVLLGAAGSSGVVAPKGVVEVEVEVEGLVFGLPKDIDIGLDIVGGGAIMRKRERSGEQSGKSAYVDQVHCGFAIKEAW